MGMYIYELEKPDDDRSLRLIAANPASTTFTGVKVEDIVGYTIDECFPGLREKGIPQHYAEVVRSGRPSELDAFQYRDERVTESIFSVKAFPMAANRVCIVFEDVTQRKRAEQEIQVANEQLRLEQRALEEKNIAMREVLGRFEEEKRTMRRQISNNLEEALTPLLARLRARADNDQRVLIDLLEQQLREIASPFLEVLRTNYTRLTPREQEICLMIKAGRRSKEIAGLLDLSLLTVHKHREKIRKKLGLNSTSVNLSSFLKTL